MNSLSKQNLALCVRTLLAVGIKVTLLAFLGMYGTMLYFFTTVKWIFKIYLIMVMTFSSRGMNTLIIFLEEAIKEMLASEMITLMDSSTTVNFIYAVRLHGLS